MIWYWLAMLGDFVVRLFAPVKARDVAQISSKMPCAVCGDRGPHKKRTVVLNIPGPGTEQKPVATVFCQLTCSSCGARTYLEPVVKVTPQLVWRSIARDEFERAEDLFWAQQKGASYIQVKQEKPQ